MMQRRDAERRAQLIESIVHKIPAGMTADEFLANLEPVASKLATVASTAQPEEAAVEGLVAAYHEQALDQAKIQFWFSVVAATVGFVWILYTGSQIDTAHVVTATKTLPGVAIDAVAFLFFKQAAETRQRATELYDRLRNDKKITEAVLVVASIEDLKVRSAVKAQIALHMAGLAPAPINLSTFLSSDAAVTPLQRAG